MSNDYKVDSIKVLSDIEHIRTRPGMYIGELDVPPLALFNEAIDNAFDEAQNDPKSETIVRITEENGLFKYSIRDHGRGIPIGEIDLPDGRKMEALEALITTTNSGAKFNSNIYKISAGLHGVGMACICALSKYMHVITYRDYEAVEFISENGIKKALNHYPEINEVNGVLTEFIADPELWNTTEIPIDSIIDRCKVANAMGYKIKLYYNNEEIKIDTKSILDLLPIENVSDYCSDTIRIDNKETGEYFLVGFKYTSDTKSKSYGYTDLLPNRYGGTHIKIITDNLCRAWREFYNDDSVWWNDSLLGVRLVVAAFISNVSFSSQTKEKLTVPYKQLNFFGEEFLKEFKKWIKENRNLADKLFARFKEYRQSLIKLQNQKDIAGKVKIATIDKEGRTRRSQIVDKLMDCTSNKVEDTELFIVEGDSAAGVVARPRDRKTQAVLPLRGKIQNVSGMSYKDALKHETVANIINSLGAGIGESADPKKCRYERIIISTDADDDGCHIVALVLTALVNLVPPLVRAGMVYLLDPPLYKYYDKDGKPIYTSDFDSVPENAKGFIRFKGLGAMEDEDFKNTCLNKNNRTLYQVTYPDDIDRFNYIAGTSAGRSELLKRYGVIKDVSAELEESEEE